MEFTNVLKYTRDHVARASDEELAWKAAKLKKEQQRRNDGALDVLSSARKALSSKILHCKELTDLQPIHEGASATLHGPAAGDSLDMFLMEQSPVTSPTEPSPMQQTDNDRSVHAGSMASPIHPGEAHSEDEEEDEVKQLERAIQRMVAKGHKPRKPSPISRVRLDMGGSNTNASGGAIRLDNCSPPRGTDCIFSPRQSIGVGSASPSVRRGRNSSEQLPLQAEPSHHLGRARRNSQEVFHEGAAAAAGPQPGVRRAVGVMPASTTQLGSESSAKAISSKSAPLLSVISGPVSLLYAGPMLAAEHGMGYQLGPGVGEEVAGDVWLDPGAVPRRVPAAGRRHKLNVDVGNEHGSDGGSGAAGWSGQRPEGLHLGSPGPAAAPAAAGRARRDSWELGTAASPAGHRMQGQGFESGESPHVAGRARRNSLSTDVAESPAGRPKPLSMELLESPAGRPRRNSVELLNSPVVRQHRNSVDSGEPPSGRSRRNSMEMPIPSQHRQQRNSMELLDPPAARLQRNSVDSGDPPSGRQRRNSMEFLDSPAGKPPRYGSMELADSPVGLAHRGSWDKPPAGAKSRRSSVLLSAADPATVAAMAAAGSHAHARHEGGTVPPTGAARARRMSACADLDMEAAMAAALAVAAPPSDMWSPFSAPNSSSNLQQQQYGGARFWNSTGSSATTSGSGNCV